MKFYVELEDFAEYEFDSNEYTEEKARELALEWFSERQPTIRIYSEDEPV